MNLVVSKDGTLQSMIPKNNNDNYINDNLLPHYNQNYINQNYTQNTEPNIKKINYKQEPLDPSVKHSFIYNKYFKDYKDSIEHPIVRVPKTIEEYKQMLLDDRIKAIEQKKRISQIKSTKLLFTTNAGSQGVIRSTKNNLRSMSFT